MGSGDGMGFKIKRIRLGSEEEYFWVLENEGIGLAFIGSEEDGFVALGLVFRVEKGDLVFFGGGLEEKGKFE